MINILVTAVGSELAFSVIKAIKLIHEKYKLIGCDIYNEVAGKYWCNNFYQVPLASDRSNYIKELRTIVNKEKINVIIPTNDYEFSILSECREEFENAFGCHILVNSVENVERFNDKWLSYLWFKEHDIPAPKSMLIDDVGSINDITANLTFPMIIKPRKGGGSRSVHKVNSKEDVLKYAAIVPSPILQEYLHPDCEEYTAGTYRTKDDNVFVIIMKRKLKFGMTNTAEVVFDHDLSCFVRDVILKTNLKGSNNVQFRVTEDGPRVLEINPRFSGTTAIRAHFGFNDVEMWINEDYLGRVVSKPIIRGGAVLRFMEEQYHFVDTP